MPYKFCTGQHPRVHSVSSLQTVRQCIRHACYFTRLQKSRRLFLKDEYTKCCFEGLWRPSLTRGGVWGSTMSHTCGFGTSIANNFAASRWPVYGCKLGVKVIIQEVAKPRKEHAGLCASNCEILITDALQGSAFQAFQCDIGYLQRVQNRYHSILLPPSTVTELS